MKPKASSVIEITHGFTSLSRPGPELEE
jgi:hypothetical protein